MISYRRNFVLVYTFVECGEFEFMEGDFYEEREISGGSLDWRTVGGGTGAGKLRERSLQFERRRKVSGEV
jgi:hypothetical protein